MDEEDLSLLPSEARRFQGAPAGVASRTAAGALDGVLVVAAFLLVYGGYLVFRLVVSPRSFRAPDPSALQVFLPLTVELVAYLALAWWTGGRTWGGRVMGLQVVRVTGARLGILRCLVRAVLYAVFPLGLLWCAVDPARRSLQDIVVRTSVVYDWLPHQAPRLSA